MSEDDPRPSVQSKGWWSRILFFIGIIVVFGAVMQQHIQSPRITCYVGSFVARFNQPLAVRWFVEPRAFGKQIAEQLSPLLYSPPIAERLKTKGMTPALVAGLIEATLPAVITAAGHATNESIDSSSQMLVALVSSAFGVTDNFLSKWNKGIETHPLRLGECKTVESRSACEMAIAGPDGDMITLALMWQRQGYRWRLVGIAGLASILDKFGHLQERTP